MGCCSCMCANVAQARPSHASPASNVAQALSSSCKRVLTKRVADCRTQSGVMWWTRTTNDDGLVTACHLKPAPWCSGFHVLDQNDMNGFAHRPDEKSMTEWIDVVIESIEKGWATKDWRSPTRSLAVTWDHDVERLIKDVKVDMNVKVDIKVDMKKQMADELRARVPARHRVMLDWCNDHWKFTTMCWERCSLKYRPHPGETAANACNRQRLLDFIRHENMEHQSAMAMANQWWRTYYEVLQPPPRDDRDPPPIRRDPPPSRHDRRDLHPYQSTCQSTGTVCPYGYSNPRTNLFIKYGPI